MWSLDDKRSRDVEQFLVVLECKGRSRCFCFIRETGTLLSAAGKGPVKNINIKFLNKPRGSETSVTQKIKVNSDIWN